MDTQELQANSVKSKKGLDRRGALRFLGVGMVAGVGLGMEIRGRLRANFEGNETISSEKTKILDLEDGQLLSIGNRQNLELRNGLLDSEKQEREVERMCVRSSGEELPIHIDLNDPEWVDPNTHDVMERKWGEIIYPGMFKVGMPSDLLGKGIEIGVWESPRAKTKKVALLSELTQENLYVIPVVANTEDWVKSEESSISNKHFMAKIDGEEVSAGLGFAVVSLVNAQGRNQVMQLRGYIMDPRVINTES